MRSVNIVQLLSFMVLSLALSSCRKAGHKTIDVYRPPTIRVLHSHALKQNSNPAHLANPDALDIQDVLSLGSPTPKRYQVRVRCTNGEQVAERTIDANGGTPAAVLNLLPPEYFTLNLAQVHPICSFVVTEWNDLESGYRQEPLVNQLIVDERPSPVALQGDFQRQKQDPYIRVEDRGRLTAVFAGDREADIHLVCTQAQSGRKTFRGLFSLGTFELADMVYADRLVAGVSLPPVQRCRLLVRQDDRLVGVSELFNVVFSFPGVDLQVVQSPSTAQNLARFEDDQDLSFANYYLTNTTEFTRQLRVPVDFPIGVEAFVEYVGRVDSIPISIRLKFEGSESWGQVRAWQVNESRHDHKLPTNEGTSRLYTLAPHESVAIEVVIQGTGNYGCTPRDNDYKLPLSNLILRAPNPLVFQINNEFGDFTDLRAPALQSLLVQRGEVRSEDELHTIFAKTDFEMKCRNLPH